MMNLPFNKKIFSEEETTELAKEFSSNIKDGDVIVINGNLGAGKTFFIKRVLELFNINSVSSPTFSLVNEYSGNKKFYHFDFYRIEKERELFDIGFDEYMMDPDAIKFIEWGELFPDILPGKRKEIEIVIGKDFFRDFTIKQYA